jgi:hypothetical protein
MWPYRLPGISWAAAAQVFQKMNIKLAPAPLPKGRTGKVL